MCVTFRNFKIDREKENPSASLTFIDFFLHLETQ